MRYAGLVGDQKWAGGKFKGTVGVNNVARTVDKWDVLVAAFVWGGVRYTDPS